MMAKFPKFKARPLNKKAPLSSFIGGGFAEMWEGLIQKTNDGGLDVIDTYVFCNLHEPSPGNINNCNGFYCDNFTPIKITNPHYGPSEVTFLGGPIHHRPVEDLAFEVAQFIQKGGSFVNYYMYHGGTNFGSTAGGRFLTTSYDYDAPIDEYGFA
ncbi:PREDICTED: beta-galactosidase 3-like [Ipomoea nil]|uniref:beta-galactosidase 3-like n=1 Tax=Ipomoea nil TaxID=35883 RepID=UPI00090127E0|nr:PREDICTED: beta-galactosidase 3-like [Ipomoea nil]XP_019186783.1 PREDICTED: beta-galactosidase 3-like [Ipomoea nil]XP_019186784.1 PREDICTED: beta-galactosidase 3-like [Ipomoea nil]